MNRELHRLTAVVCAGLVLLCGRGFAQTTFGSITGTVVDPSGASVPGAAVTLTSETTGAVWRVKSELTGVFAVPDLEGGAYRVNPNFYQPDLNITDGAYPQGTAGVLGGTTSANGLGEPTTREIDLSLKLMF